MAEKSSNLSGNEDVPGPSTPSTPLPIPGQGNEPPKTPDAKR